MLALSSPGYGQRLSLGVIGGTNITGHFPLTSSSGPADGLGNPAFRFEYGTGSRSVILGAVLEGHLTDSVSIEANILHRPMKSTINFTEFHPDGRTVINSTNLTAVRAWQFPILLKYTFRPPSAHRRVEPFFAAGPAFRTQEDATAVEPSQVGFAAGFGASIRAGRFRLAPTLRYYRWKREDISPRYATKPDQLEILTSFTFDTTAKERRINGHRVGFGAVMGVPLIKGLPLEGGRYLAGLSVQAEVAGPWSVEVNGLYRPIRIRNPAETRFSILTWQLPVLAKYTSTRPGWSPFLEGGPSARLSGNLNGYNPSRLGATFGAGMSKRISGTLVEPALRYTRWRRSTARFLALPDSTNVHSLDLVLGVSF